MSRLLVLKEGSCNIHEPQKKGDAGYDLVAAEVIKRTFFSVWYSTNLSVKIPDGTVGLLFPRSNITNASALTLGNSVGVVDSGYTGKIQIRFNRTLKGIFTRKEYSVGERIAQLVIVPYLSIPIKLVDELPTTERSGGGHGHTGMS